MCRLMIADMPSFEFFLVRSTRSDIISSGHARLRNLKYSWQATRKISKNETVAMINTRYAAFEQLIRAVFTQLKSECKRQLGALIGKFTALFKTRV